MIFLIIVYNSHWSKLYLKIAVACYDHFPNMINNFGNHSDYFCDKIEKIEKTRLTTLKW